MLLDLVNILNPEKKSVGMYDRKYMDPVSWQIDTQSRFHDTLILTNPSLKYFIYELMKSLAATRLTWSPNNLWEDRMQLNDLSCSFRLKTNNAKKSPVKNRPALNERTISPTELTLQSEYYTGGITEGKYKT